MTQQNEFQTFEVKLPSEGLNYPDDCGFKKGTVELKYGTSREETILMDNQLIKKGTVLDELLKSLMIEKEDIGKLFPGDYNALIVAARVSMYGSNWEATIPCPSCGIRSKLTIDISKFDNYENTKEFKSGNFEYTSSLKNKYTYKILTKEELSEFESFISGMKKKNIKTNQVAEFFFRCITSVNGKKDKAELKTYFDTMPAIEAREVREHILENSPDINLETSFTCPSCDYEGDVEIPIDISFFWRAGSRKKRV